MSKGKKGQEFRMKNEDEIRIYLVEEIEGN